MQNESIELPNNMDDMQLLLLKFREEIITGTIFVYFVEFLGEGVVSLLEGSFVGQSVNKWICTSLFIPRRGAGNQQRTMHELSKVYKLFVSGYPVHH